MSVLLHQDKCVVSVYVPCTGSSPRLGSWCGQATRCGQGGKGGVRLFKKKKEAQGKNHETGLGDEEDDGWHLPSICAPLAFVSVLFPVFPFFRSKSTPSRPTFQADQITPRGSAWHYFRCTLRTVKRHSSTASIPKKTTEISLCTDDAYVVHLCWILRYIYSKLSVIQVRVEIKWIWKL